MTSILEGEASLESPSKQSPPPNKSRFQFCHGNEKSQKSLLGSIEMLICQSYPSLLDKTAHILKGLYDTDLVDENILIDWHHRVRVCLFVCLVVRMFVRLFLVVRVCFPSVCLFLSFSVRMSVCSDLRLHFPEC